ncbi:hypothetical protein BH24ACT13_BH24ACT13_11550 [soil metagenome]
MAAAFLDPAKGAVVEEVLVGEASDCCIFGSSVGVSPDRSKVAVTSGFATTVLDTRTREVPGRKSSSHRPAAAIERERHTPRGWSGLRRGVRTARTLHRVPKAPTTSTTGAIVVVNTAT